MEETATTRTWTIGEELQSLQFGYQATFGFAWGAPGRGTMGSVTVETSFVVLSPDKNPITVDPANAETFSALLRLLHQKIDRISAHRSGLLEISFANGTIVRVEKRNDGYESWNSFGNGELHDFNMLCSSHDVAPWAGPSQ
jgi:hypothetical protein